MSGGFFRGMSVDQDTRFSNKQAKLLKSQKFAPELDHLISSSICEVNPRDFYVFKAFLGFRSHFGGRVLNYWRISDQVDMTKVKMDVIQAVDCESLRGLTRLLGFEVEVLIIFVYGLVDGKEVDGKQIQIQLTGFMEKNTAKFMKELWSLLLKCSVRRTMSVEFLNSFWMQRRKRGRKRPRQNCARNSEEER